VRNWCALSPSDTPEAQARRLLAEVDDPPPLAVVRVDKLDEVRHLVRVGASEPASHCDGIWKPPMLPKVTGVSVFRTGTF
jgi:hypothetical protein